MKPKLLPKSLLFAAVTLSLFSFIYVNAHAGLVNDQAVHTTKTLEPSLPPIEEQPEEQALRLPDVAVLGFLLQLAGLFLPVSG